MSANFSDKQIVLYNSAKDLVPLGRDFIRFYDPSEFAGKQDKAQISQLQFLMALGTREFSDIKEGLEVINQKVSNYNLTLETVSKNIEKIKDSVIELPSRVVRILPSEKKIDLGEIEKKINSILTLVEKTPMETDVQPKKSEAIERLNILVSSTSDLNQKIKDMDKRLEVVQRQPEKTLNKLQEIEQILGGTNLVISQNTERLDKIVSQDKGKEIINIEKMELTLLDKLYKGFETIREQVSTLKTRTGETSQRLQMSESFIIYDPPQSYIHE